MSNANDHRGSKQLDRSTRRTPVPSQAPGAPAAEQGSDGLLLNPSLFRGRVHVVTGAAHGIGEATIRMLAAHGSAVVALDIDAANLQRVESALADAGADALCLRGDVADERFLVRAVREAQKRWGRIDGWVNNAMYNPFGTPQHLSPSEFHRTWRTNVEAAWIAARLLAPVMRQQQENRAPNAQATNYPRAGRAHDAARDKPTPDSPANISRCAGSIVNLSSILAHRTQRHSVAYGMTKAALEGFTRTLAVDLAPYRIRVNAVVPGHIDTRERPVACRPRPKTVPPAALKKSLALRQRMHDHFWQMSQPWPSNGQPDEVAAMILFLLCDAASFITGACIAVDGGASVVGPMPGKIDYRAVSRDFKQHHAMLAQDPTLGRSNLTSKPGNAKGSRRPKSRTKQRDAKAGA